MIYEDRCTYRFSSFCFYKIVPSLSDFCYPDVLKTWQQSTPKLENFKWVNISCKSSSQSYGKSKITA